MVGVVRVVTEDIKVAPFNVKNRKLSLKLILHVVVLK